MRKLRICSVCGGTEFTRQPVLWGALIDEWQLSLAEIDYVNRQQGEACTTCGSNLRSIALADALRAFKTRDVLSAFASTPEAATFKVLEINGAGTLGPVLRRLPGHILAEYPEIDMHSLLYPDASFDVVVHSDTLEHVLQPLHALSECRRVLQPGAAFC